MSMLRELIVMDVKGQRVELDLITRQVLIAGKPLTKPETVHYKTAISNKPGTEWNKQVSTHTLSHVPTHIPFEPLRPFYQMQGAIRR